MEAGPVITDYHAKLFAHELSRRHSVADAEELAGALLDAQVDLNPHQVEAALLAFKSPLSKGAILADEVGLGKTINAGLVLAQNWTEERRTKENQKIACSRRHFDTLGVNFDVVASLTEVST